MCKKNYIKFALTLKKGPVAERLGRGLQNLVQRFESARDLQKPPTNFVGGFFINSKLNRLTLT